MEVAIMQSGNRSRIMLMRGIPILHGHHDSLSLTCFGPAQLPCWARGLEDDHAIIPSATLFCGIPLSTQQPSRTRQEIDRICPQANHRKRQLHRHETPNISTPRRRNFETTRTESEHCIRITTSTPRQRVHRKKGEVYKRFASFGERVEGQENIL